jgi:hypothetical protein
MKARKRSRSVDQLPPIDKLMTRPEGPELPTPLDPAGPEAHGYPADPKPMPRNDPDDFESPGPRPDDIGRSA